MAGELGVESSADGGATWTKSWQADAAERKELGDKYSTAVFHNPELSSVALGVRDVPGGQIVVVANGLDGFRQRDPDGTWRRIGLPALFGRGEAVRPGLTDPATERSKNIMLVLAVAVLLASVVICVGGARSSRRQGGSSWWCAPVLLALFATLPLISLARGPDDFFAYAGPAVSIFVSLLAAALVSGLAPGEVEGKGWWALRVWGAGLLTALIGAACCVAWRSGVFPGWVGVLLCLVAVAPGLLIAWRAEPIPSLARLP
jgi:hypothetical protein